MNIQIFGTNKSFDTKKAQRWFKERRIKFQMVDLKEKGLSAVSLTACARPWAAGRPGRRNRQRPGYPCPAALAGRKPAG